MLRQEYFMGDDEVGRQLVDEARYIYYAKNWFKAQICYANSCSTTLQMGYLFLLNLGYKTSS